MWKYCFHCARVRVGYLQISVEFKIFGVLVSLKNIPSFEKFVSLMLNNNSVYIYTIHIYVLLGRVKNVCISKSLPSHHYFIQFFNVHSVFHKRVSYYNP